MCLFFAEKYLSKHDLKSIFLVCVSSFGDGMIPFFLSLMLLIQRRFYSLDDVRDGEGSRDERLTDGRMNELDGKT